MKKIIIIILSILTLSLSSCNSDDDNGDTSTTATVKVNVTVEGLGAIEGVSVVLVELITDSEIQEKVTNSEGKVTFENISPGTYNVGGWYIPTQDEEHIGQSDNFQLIEDQTKTITLLLD